MEKSFTYSIFYLKSKPNIVNTLEFPINRGVLIEGAGKNAENLISAGVKISGGNFLKLDNTFGK